MRYLGTHSRLCRSRICYTPFESLMSNEKMTEQLRDVNATEEAEEPKSRGTYRLKGRKYSWVHICSGNVMAEPMTVLGHAQPACCATAPTSSLTKLRQGTLISERQVPPRQKRLCMCV